MKNHIPINKSIISVFYNVWTVYLLKVYSGHRTDHHFTPIMGVHCYIGSSTFHHIHSIRRTNISNFIMKRLNKNPITTRMYLHLKFWITYSHTKMLTKTKSMNEKNPIISSVLSQAPIDTHCK